MLAGMLTLCSCGSFWDTLSSGLDTYSNAMKDSTASVTPLGALGETILTTAAGSETTETVKGVTKTVQTVKKQVGQ